MAKERRGSAEEGVGVFFGGDGGQGAVGGKDEGFGRQGEEVGADGVKLGLMVGGGGGAADGAAEEGVAGEDAVPAEEASAGVRVSWGGQDGETEAADFDGFVAMEEERGGLDFVGAGVALDGIAFLEFGQAFGVVPVAMGEEEVTQVELVGIDEGGDLFAEAAGIDKDGDARIGIGDEVAVDGIAADGEAAEDHRAVGHRFTPWMPSSLSA